MALQYLFDPNKQFQSIGGVNEVSGFLRVFLNGTDDRATTYRNFDGGLNEPDIVLDSYGRAVVIVDDTKTYRIEVYNRLGGLMWTVSNYKARGGSGGGSGTPVSVEGTAGEIDVDENTEGGVKHFVVGLASTIKNAIATLTMAVNGVANALNGKKDKQSPVSVSGGTTKTLVGISQDSDGVMTPEFDDIEFPDYSQRFNNIENEQAVDAKVIAAALNDLNARMESVEASQGDNNIGDRTADLLDAQVLMVGGIPVKFRQAVKNFLGSATKTITGLSQNANGEITPVFSDIDFDSKVLSFYPQSLGYMTPDERAALNAKMQEVANNGGMIILWDRSFPCILYYYNSSEYYFYHIEKNGNRIDYLDFVVTYDGVSKTFNVDTSETIIDPALYEKLANKKTTFTGNTSSDTFYPTIKAVVDYLDSRLQNLGGKKITNNGVPFTAASQLPTTTPYYGQNINSDDYAYVQDTGLASRYTATVTGSSVAWSLDYEIAIPVFTSEQQNAIDSGITSEKVSGYDSHVENGNIHVTASQKTEWSGKQDALNSSQMGAVNSGITSGKVDGYDSHVSDTDIHVTASEKTTWNAKQNAISDLAEIRSGAAAGATALQPSGNGSNVTAAFTASGTRTNISTGDKLSVIFGKIAKWFGDLKAVAFSGSYSDLSDKPTIPTVNNGTLTIQKNGSDVATFSANQSGNASANIIVPTDTNDLTNGAGFITASQIPSTDDLVLISINASTPYTDVAQAFTDGKTPVLYYGHQITLQYYWFISKTASSYTFAAVRKGSFGNVVTEYVVNSDNTITNSSQTSAKRFSVNDETLTIDNGELKWRYPGTTYFGSASSNGGSVSWIPSMTSSQFNRKLVDIPLPAAGMYLVQYTGTGRFVDSFTSSGSPGLLFKVCIGDQTQSFSLFAGNWQFDNSANDSKYTGFSGFTIANIPSNYISDVSLNISNNDYAPPSGSSQSFHWTSLRAAWFRLPQ